MVIFDPSTGQYIEVPDQQPYQIRIPFLNRSVGAGDVVQGITEAAGIQSCTPCEERRKRLNQKVVFTPWQT